MTPQAREEQAINLVTLLGIGSTFGGCVAIGVFAGVLADDGLGTSPLLALLGTLLGILAGAGGAYQIIRPYTRSSSRPRRARPDDDVGSDTR